MRVVGYHRLLFLRCDVGAFHSVMISIHHYSHSVEVEEYRPIGGSDSMSLRTIFPGGIGGCCYPWANDSPHQRDNCA